MVKPGRSCPRCGLAEIPDGDTKCPKCGTSVSEHGQAIDPLADIVLENVRTELESDYRIERVLGHGGMSVVLLARELELSRLVALKILPLQFSMGPDAPERFKREAKMAASLDHPNIVPVHRVGTTPTFLWYSMKYVRGRSLSAVLRETGPMNVVDCLGIFEQVARALDYAHHRGIVHRDIKPANILIDEHGWVSVCDFGVARAFGALPLTQTGTTIGTPAYMSTEQCYGQALDGRADQYSLAIVIYECFTGHPPFVSTSLGELVRMHCMEPAPRLEDDRPDIDKRLSDALVRAMSKQPEQRFESVGELVEALGGQLARLTTTPVTPVETMESLSTAPTEPLDTEPRARRLWPTIAAALLFIVAGGVWIRGVTRPTPQTMTTTPPAAEAIAAPGILAVSSRPWGNLYIDDSLVGPTPQPAVKLAPGTYRLRIVRDGFEPHEQEVEIATGEELRLTGIVLNSVQQ